MLSNSLPAKGKTRRDASADFQDNVYFSVVRSEVCGKCCVKDQRKNEQSLVSTDAAVPELRRDLRQGSRQPRRRDGPGHRRVHRASLRQLLLPGENHQAPGNGNGLQEVYVYKECTLQSMYSSSMDWLRRVTRPG